MKTLLAIIASVALSGCSYGEIYGRHISTPDKGEPFTNANKADGSLVESQVNELGLLLGWCPPPSMRLCFESSLGYDLSSGKATGIRGGPWLYEGRVSVRIFGEGR